MAWQCSWMNQPYALSPFRLSGWRPGRAIWRIHPPGRPPGIDLAGFSLFKNGQKLVRNAFLDDIRIDLAQLASDRILAPTSDARVQARLLGVMPIRAIATVVAAPVSFSSHILLQLLMAVLRSHIGLETRADHVGSAIN